jgi:alpha-D-xyloside xylohydrolase
MNIQKLHNGIYKLTFGEPEKFTAATFKRYEAKADALSRLSDREMPFDPGGIDFKTVKSGCALRLPLSGGEEIYGFGLQLKGFRHTGKKKHIRPNADPLSDSGDSHAPLPYYVSTKGYAVLVDTARYASFYCGQAKDKGVSREAWEAYNAQITEEALYSAHEKESPAKMLVEIPVAKGIDVYVFAGENMLEAVSKYNLFSGGGADFPEWAFGIWYRNFGKSTSDDWLNTARKFKEQGIPCSVFGLEPGWQSASYSCSYVWDGERAKNYKDFLKLAKEMGFRVNLWEHAFVHPSSPIYNKLSAHSGDYEVWKGLVPDFADGEARRIFADYHKKIVAEGISGFKLDECDGSDFTNGWSFPNSAEFPSGLDGEQMHSLFGILYQQTVISAFDELSAHQVRNSHAFAAPYPFVLYSDLYGHKDYIRGMANMGFSGLLWMPEVRVASSVKDFIRRIQTVILSPLAQIDAWYIPNPPWEQIDRAKNTAGEKMENAGEVTELVKELFKLREELIPYLKEAFDTYKNTGVPPFRALVLDYPDDRETYSIEDQYMLGDKLMAAPLTEESDIRRFYIPEGKWKNRQTGEIFEKGFHEKEFALTEIPLFEKIG